MRVSIENSGHARPLSASTAWVSSHREESEDCFERIWGVVRPIFQWIGQVFHDLYLWIFPPMAIEREAPVRERRGEGGPVAPQVLDPAPLLRDLPERKRGQEVAGHFEGTINQYRALDLLIQGSSACTFCALNMGYWLWKALLENKSFSHEQETTHFIDAVVRQGVEKRISYQEQAVDQAVDVLEALYTSFVNQLFLFYQIEPNENGAIITYIPENPRALYLKEIQKLQRYALSTPAKMIFATFLKGGQTHMLLVDARHSPNIYFYHFDSHGKNQGNAYIEIKKTAHDFAGHLTEVAPYVPVDAHLRAASHENRYQIIPFRVNPHAH